MLERRIESVRLRPALLRHLRQQLEAATAAAATQAWARGEIVAAKGHLVGSPSPSTVRSAFAEQIAADRGAKALRAAEAGDLPAAVRLATEAATLEAEHAAPGAWASFAEALLAAPAMPPGPKDPVPPPRPEEPAPTPEAAPEEPALPPPPPPRVPPAPLRYAPMELSPEEATRLLQRIAQGGRAADLVLSLLETASLASQGPPGRQSPQLLIEDIVCRVFVVSAEELSSTSRHRNLADARGALYRALREYTHLSLTQLGERYQRHHATVMNSIETFTARCGKEPTLQDLWSRIAAELEELGLGRAP